MRPRRARHLIVALAVLALMTSGAVPDALARRSGQATMTDLFVTFVRDGRVASARRVREVADLQVGTAAMRALLEGPNEAEIAAGLTTALPPETELRGLTVDQETRIATVDLSADFLAPPEEMATPPATTAPRGTTDPSRLRLAQVVYTLTQFPTVERVSVQIDGAPLTSFDPDGDGGLPETDLTAPVGRADFEDVTPLIFVISPTVGDRIASPVRVYGTANVFEAVFFIQVQDGEGNLLVEQQVMATSGTGTRGTFDVEITFPPTDPGPGMLVAFDRSPRDGAAENIVAIPVEIGEATGA